MHYREHKIEADLGPLMIAYRETAVKAARDTITFERSMLDRNYSITIDIEISLPGDGQIQVGHPLECRILQTVSLSLLYHRKRAANLNWCGRNNAARREIKLNH